MDKCCSEKERMNFIVIIGLVAGALTTLSYIPEVHKIITTKTTLSISLMWLLILFTGVIIWFIYGILIMSIPLILSNGVGAVLIFIMLIFKFKYGQDSDVIGAKPS